MLVVGRIISGICVGMASAVVPVYQSEITPPAIRGRMVSLQQWLVVALPLVRRLLMTLMQVHHLGYPPPVLRPVWLLLHGQRGILPHPLGPADDPRHRPLAWHVRVP